MPMTIADPIRGHARGGADQALAGLVGPGQHDRDYITEIFASAPLVGLDPAIVVAQWSHETARGTSPRWNNDFNPAGLGIPSDDAQQPFHIPDGKTAALIHLSALNRIVLDGRPEPWTLPRQAVSWLTSIWKQHVADGPSVRTIDDLNIRFRDAAGVPQATWAWDDQYEQKLVDNHGNALFPGLPNATPIGPEPLPSPPRIDLAIKGGDLMFTDGPNFPGRRLTYDELTITWHNTGNTNVGAGAKMHRDFVFNGGGVDRVSFHFAVDDREAWQIMALDQVGWHAGDNCDEATDVGCLGSIAIETCMNADGDWTKTKSNLVALTAAIILGDDRIDYGTSRGRFSVARIAPHQRWSGKFCPAKILGEGSLPSLVAEVEAAVRGGIFPEGLDKGLAARWFGKVTANGIDYAFNERGSVSPIWLKLGRFPRLRSVNRFDTRTYFRFHDGAIIWRPNDQASVGVLTPAANGERYPEGLDRSLARKWFGRAVDDGGFKRFSEDDGLGRFWLGLGRCPQIVSVDRAAGKTFYRFKDGTVALQRSSGEPALLQSGDGAMPAGVSDAVASRWFGSVTTGGRTYKLDPGSSLGRLWLGLGRYPTLQKVERYGDRRYFRFSDGMVAWRPNDGEELRWLTPS